MPDSSLPQLRCPALPYGCWHSTEPSHDVPHLHALALAGGPQASAAARVLGRDMTSTSARTRKTGDSPKQ